MKADALLADLKERYPTIAARLPLAVGVRDELIAIGFDAELLRRSLYVHVHGIRYQRMLAKGGKRFHLDGTEASDITDEHIESAKQKVAEYDRINAERKQRKKEFEAQAVANAAAKLKRTAIAKAPAKAPLIVKVAIKPTAKAPVAAPAVAVVVKKRRTVQVPK